MTYEREYKLADKMQKQFRNRGQAVSGMQASSTSELMRRAEMGRDPRVNCAEQAFRESYRSRQTQRNPRMQSAGTQNRSGRNDAAHANPYAQRNTGRVYTQNAERQYANRSKARAESEMFSAQAEPEENIEPAVEIKVRQKAFPPMFIAMLLLGTLMVMCLVFSISEVYQSTNQIAQLESELEALQSEAAQLRLRLEEKNDVRTIEEIATTELGMVKEDSLQRRYVSLSDGEYIELVGNENEADESTGGVMLSSIFSSLGKFFERFK